MGKGIKILVDGLDAAAQKLNFLHNTNAERMLRYEQMGGLPVPSLGVTKQDIPFEGYGDITLLGKPSAFDPKTSATNKVYSADAYTARAPQPVRLAKKDAFKTFQSKYPNESLEYSYALEELSTKKRLNEGSYGQVFRFFKDDPNATQKFLLDTGISIPDEVAGDKYKAADYIKKNHLDEYTGWVSDEMAELFEPGEFFISNPDRDYVTGSAKLKPYNADEITSFMKRAAGKNSEGGFSSSGLGAQRAATTEQYRSLGKMRENMGNLAPSDAVDALKESQQEEFFSLANELSPYYNYQSDGLYYMNAVSELVMMSESRGMDSALREIGFSDVPKEVVEKLTAYKNNLRNAPTQYFEAKPTRKVEMTEFGGAIIPENTPKSTIDVLEKNNIPYEIYKTPEERTALRKKFGDTAFSAASVLGAGAATGLGLAPEDATASEVSELQQALEGVDLSGMEKYNYPMTGDYVALGQRVEAPVNPVASWMYNHFRKQNNVYEKAGLDIIALHGIEDYLRKFAYGDDINYWDRFWAGLDINPL